MKSKLAYALPIVLSVLGCDGKPKQDIEIKQPAGMSLSEGIEKKRIETMKEIGKRIFGLSDEENTTDRVQNEIDKISCRAFFNSCMREGGDSETIIQCARERYYDYQRSFCHGSPRRGYTCDWDFDDTDGDGCPDYR